MGHARHAFLTLALLVGGSETIAAPDDAVVNERPPVTRAQMEDRWGVDCATAAQALYALLNANPAQAEALVSLSGPIRLCAHLDRMQERREIPFVHLAASLHDLMTCLETDHVSCADARAAVLEILRGLDVHQGEES